MLYIGRFKCLVCCCVEVFCVLFCWVFFFGRFIFFRGVNFFLGVKRGVGECFGTLRSRCGSIIVLNYSMKRVSEEFPL